MPTFAPINGRFIQGFQSAGDVAAPTLSSATINAAGTSLTLAFSEAVSIGAGGNGGWATTLSGGAATLTYASGSGTASLVYTLSRTVGIGETGTVAYTQPGSGVEDAAGNDLATIASAAVTNNSTQTTMEVYYVDPSAATSTEDGTTANPYKSLNAALVGKCNLTFTLPIQIRCRTSGSTADTTRANTGALGQMVTSATNYLQIVAETGHRAGRSWNAAKYNLSVAFASGAGAGVAFANAHSYVKVDGLQISCSSQAGQDASCEIVYTSEDTGNFCTCVYSNCLIKGTRDAGAGGITRGISVIFGVTLINCILYDMGSAAGTSPVKNHGSSKFYSCTFISHGSGAIITVDHTNDTNGNGTAIAKNCYAGGATFHDYDIGSGTLTMTNCASSDTTAVGTSPQVSKPVSTTHFNDVTAGSQDWGLPGTSALKDNGADTSGEASPLNFTTDIEGTARTGAWDIGAVAA